MTKSGEILEQVREKPLEKLGIRLLNNSGILVNGLLFVLYALTLISHMASQVSVVNQLTVNPAGT